MARKGYVLVKCEGSKIREAVQMIRQKPGVVAADVVTGAHDIIVTLQAADAEDVAKIVLNDIAGVSGVTGTTTYLAVSLA
ncbi:MAG: Lrp/AsnC ligand binding domain-containing protein [Dehalococcoidia bacterium]|nr:Lrp/AsnC ligand binding domain-containing protein [Dehalococcoidia bacterium]